MKLSKPRDRNVFYLSPDELWECRKCNHVFGDRLWASVWDGENGTPTLGCPNCGKIPHGNFKHAGEDYKFVEDFDRIKKPRKPTFKEKLLRMLT